MYGAAAAHLAEEAPRSPKYPISGMKSHVRLSERRSVSPIAFLLSFILPCAIFIATDCARTHQRAHSSLNWTLSAAGVVLLLAYPAWLSWRRRDDPNREPSWSVFLLGTCLFAWVLAFVLGSQNYELSGELREYEKLDYYVEVNASRAIGLGVQDAGRLFFLPGSRLDLSKSMSFMSSNNYCVAPVVAANTSGGGGPIYYDFWAVGIGCCGLQGSDYQCGPDYNNPKAAAGLRDLDEASKAYYRLAVESAEAAYNINVAHPIFLQWMQDPVEHLTRTRVEAGRRLLIQISAFAVWQFFAVVVAAVVFTRLYLFLGPPGFK